MPRLLCIALLSGLMAACANLKTVYRNHDVNGTQVMVTDGGQRVVTATEVPYGNDPKSTEKRLLVCKEKYPDVFWAMAESGSLTIEIASKGAGSGAFASSQEAGFAGLRTQLRESQARMLDGLCDLYAGGAITRDELEIQLRRYQNHILAALAIEQLTGYARPTAITLGGKGHAGVAADMQEAQKKLDAAEAELVTKNNALATAKAAEEKERKALEDLDKANPQPDDAKKKEIEIQTKKAAEAKTALTAAETDAADQEANVKAMRANRDAARHAVYASTESSESAISQPQQHVLSDNAAKHIAGAVEEIVKVAFRQHYMAEQCQRFVFDDKRNNDREDVRAEFCIKYFQAIADNNLGSGDKVPDTVYSKDLSLVLSFGQKQKALDKREADLNKREKAVKNLETRSLQEW